MSGASRHAMRVMAMGWAGVMFTLAMFSARPAQTCNSSPKPPVCAVSGVMIKTSPVVIVSPPAPIVVNLPVTVVMACSPPGCATFGLSTATLDLTPFGGGPVVATGMAMFTPGPCTNGLSFTAINVPVPVPAGLVGLFTVSGTASVPTAAPNLPPGSVTTIAGDTVISFVEEAPGQPGVPRLDLKLIDPDPSNSVIYAGPGSQVAATYRLTNNDPTESVTVTLTATSKQGARLPTGNAALYSIAAPFVGDDFPIAFDAPECSIPLPADPGSFVQPPITQTVTLMPGETKDVKVSSRSFPKCPSGSCSEETLLAEGSFSGGDPVEACASTAHLVQVGLPNNCCGVPDTTCPRCDLAGPFTNGMGQSFIEVTVQDNGSGLGFVIPTHQQNIELSEPAFMYGTTSPIMITGTKQDQSLKASVQFMVVDACGNKVVCDPVITGVLRGTGKPVEQTHTNLPAAERMVTVINGAPGLNHLEVIVNGETYRLNGLKDGEERTIDVGASMLPGDANTIALRTAGKPGCAATVMIWDDGQN